MKQKNICDELLYSNDDILGIVYYQRRPSIKSSKLINKYQRDIHNEAFLLINDIEIKDLIYLEYNFDIKPMKSPSTLVATNFKIDPPSIGLIYSSISKGKFEIRCDNVICERDLGSDFVRLNFTPVQSNDKYTIVLYDEN